MRRILGWCLLDGNGRYIILVLYTFFEMICELENRDGDGGNGLYLICTRC
jgi:hypothetical protein